MPGTWVAAKVYVPNSSHSVLSPPKGPFGHLDVPVPSILTVSSSGQSAPGPQPHSPVSDSAGESPSNPVPPLLSIVPNESWLAKCHRSQFVVVDG